MEWTSRTTATALVAEPHGRIDETSWEAFLGHVTAAIADASRSQVSLIIDLHHVEYMSSRGLRVLTIAKRESDAAHVALSLARPNSRMTEILSISRYDKIFPVQLAVED